MPDYPELLPNRGRTDTPEFLRPSPQLSQLNEIYDKQYEINLRKKNAYERLLKMIQEKYPQWDPMQQHLHATGLVDMEIRNNYTGYRKEQLNKRTY